MNIEPTQMKAREQLYRHFLRTLRMLPAGSALSLSHPELPQARLHSGVVLPVDDSAGRVDAEFFDIAYWLVAATPGAESRYFDSIVRAWERFGWPTRADRDFRPRAAYTRTPDHVGFSVQESVDGFVSLSGSTAPFAVGSAAGPPFPELIEHPLITPEVPPKGSSGGATDPLTGRAHPR
ncbi:hypothetical protein [Nocardia rhamnosiphila]|uniref:hypothetical protein n=1 Tax=Nocardia rhamnosiphila TaxID=426716 RepID=UPI0004C33779|nr:hypothetical protein [Nocardia rhamnosiphila]